ncbi:MAG: ABC transporter permease [Clostridiales Family XIII bacterium]|jgi:ABC-2 type transport system permease protein|nr:ABC transporter permease [Clostridiales Family XIII bacterium]
MEITVKTTVIGTVGDVKKPSRVFREISTIWAIVCREVSVAFKSPGTLIMSLAMPLVMMGMIGGNLTQNMADGLNFDFGMFMLVGMMINMLFMATSQGVATLVDDHEDNFSEEMLIAPVSRYAIVIGKICGSAFSAVVTMLGTLIVGAVMGITLSFGQFLSILALSPLICLAAGSLAMLFIGLIKNRKAANLAVMLIIMPQMFLSGAIIPIGNSSGLLWVISRMLPMTYCLDLTRAVVYAGTPEYGAVTLFNPLVSITGTICITVVCLTVGTFFYARSEKDR